MPKRSILAVGLLALAISACKGVSAPTPRPTPTPTPTTNPVVTTATVNAQYRGSAYNGTIYANAAPSGCPGSTTISGSTLSAPASTNVTVNGQPYGQAVFSSTNGNALTANTYYTFFYVVGGGPTVSLCTLNWTYGVVTLSYP